VIIARKKRSQITLFIILGILVLLAITTYIYVQQINKNAAGKKDLSELYNIGNNLEPVRLYTEACIRQTAEPIIRRIGNHGGTSEPFSYRNYYGTRLNYLCIHDDEHGCMSTLLLRQGMELEISEHVKKELERCVNLNIFRKQGYEIEEGQIDVRTRVGLDEITINVDYPLVFTNKDINKEIRGFESKLSFPLGRLYLLATSITNTETSKGFFDHVKFMQDSAGTVIEKHRPYPDIVYMLNSNNYSFNFAVQGVDTASQPGSAVPEKSKKLGCCFIRHDNNCYKNVKQLECQTYNGTYDPSPNCQCPAPSPNELSKTNQSRTYRGCVQEDGSVKKNGESWCEYDGIAGYGFDNVGSRHYMHYCVDGREYIEECRDFREELCTEDSVLINDNIESRAMCRPNRWQDCSRCTTEECCENEEFRDCFWTIESSADSGTSDKRCRPFVPPGFRHWDNSGRDTCSLASVENMCNGFSCGNTWLNNAAKNCYMQGDCGNYWNTEGKVTYNGFFHTDIIANSDTTAYNIRKQAEIAGINNTGESRIDKGTENRKQTVLVENRLQPAVDNFARIVTSVYSMLDGITTLSVPAQLRDESGVEVMQVAICEPWRAPEGDDDCSKCSEDEKKPCTEYLCRSLGQRCIFEEKEGVPECREMPKDDKTKLVISPDDTKLPDGYSIEKQELEIGTKKYKGYKVTPELKPYKIFTLGVNTSKNSICRQHYAPKSGLLDTGGYYFGEPVFSTQHILQLRVPARPAFPKKLMELLNTTTMQGFSESITGIKESAGQAEESLFAKLYRKLMRRSITDGIVPVAERLVNVLALFNSETAFYREASEIVFDKFEDGGYYLFVYCEDSSGNPAKEPIFFDLTISRNTDDNEAPRILSTYPSNNSKYADDAEKIELMLYLDEPAECRYSVNDSDYGQMENAFSCAISRYSISPYFGGSYLCSGEIGLDESDEELELFIRCRDNPRLVKEFGFVINKSNENRINGVDVNASRLINITEDGRITIAGFMLKQNLKQDIVFSINNSSDNSSESSSAIIDIYVDDDADCRASYSPGRETVGICNRSDDFELGSYICRFELDLSVEPANTTNATNTTIITDSTNTTDSADIGDTGSNHADNPDKTTEIPVSILCEEKDVVKRNTNKESYFYTLKRSDPLEIVDYAPIGEVGKGRHIMYVDTTKSEDVVCGYYKDLSFGMQKMDSIGKNRHAVELEFDELKHGENIYYISCSDTYGNDVEQMIRFYVVG